MRKLPAALGRGCANGKIQFFRIKLRFLFIMAGIKTGAGRGERLRVFMCFLANEDVNGIAIYVYFRIFRLRFLAGF